MEDVFCKQSLADDGGPPRGVSRSSTSSSTLLQSLQPFSEPNYRNIISPRFRRQGPDKDSDKTAVITPRVPRNRVDLGPDYWVQNFVSPVLFADAVAALLQLQHDHPSSQSRRRRRTPRPGDSSAFDLLLEVGPHSALKGPLRQILQHHGISTVAYTSFLYRGEDAAESAVRAASELYMHGVPVCVSAVSRSPLDTSSIKPLVDLPSYPWDHSLSYWAESRVSRNHRLRTFGRRDLLGTPAADASAKQPRWRNSLRVQEQPWLRHHVVQSSTLFPGAGSLTMVPEAVRQLALQYGDQNGDRPILAIESIKLQHVRIAKAIVVPDDPAGIEVVLQLQYDDDISDDREKAWDFAIQVCSDGRSLDPASSRRVTQRARAEYTAAIDSCTHTIDPAVFYRATRDAGLQYGPLFQGLAEIAAGPHRCAATVTVADTRESMPAGAQSTHLIHPATLDAIFHSMFAALMVTDGKQEGGDDQLDLRRAAVPIAFDSLIFYPSIPNTPGDQLRSCCLVERRGVQDLVADNYVSSDMAFDEPNIIVQAPVGTLVWKPDIALLDNAKLESYFFKKSGAMIASIVDLAAHKNPDFLAVLEIGPSDLVVDSLLPTLHSESTQDEGVGDDKKNMRCSQYTVLVPEAETMSALQERLSSLRSDAALSAEVLTPDVLAEAEGRNSQTIVLIQPAEPDTELKELSNQLLSQLASRGMPTEPVRWSAELKLDRLRGKMLVFLLETQSAFLQDISPQDFAALKTLLLNSA
ncbi:polyketide synthase dehydratase-domain-containing protein [Chaetomium strumarium]|uniref:Polyketide synthase dehydratase-domain-containing protein n=1 Tax=Chaetomium strumarium TaxID=1170767 RepID=A0AAJ0GRT9_9PEZI|nr:polyketide synthase dehydratase-domain-containing protein [Chaetomium strumarium]